VKLESLRETLKKLLAEDVGPYDITTSILIPENHKSRALIRAKDNFVLAGIPFAEEIFRIKDPDVEFKERKKDGEVVRAGDIIIELKGKTASLLTSERVALNMLQRLSGIATLTKAFVEEAKGFPVKIVDTRKTTPGLRFFEKYAVRVSGGFNHRFGLFDGILIKDNHLQAVGGIKNAIKKAKEGSTHLLKIEVEVKNLKELEEALKSGADAIMLDNMSVKDMVSAVKLTKGRAILEASGNINLKNVRSVAETGVDIISIGALTHSAVAVDISMELISSGSYIDKKVR